MKRLLAAPSFTAWVSVALMAVLFIAGGKQWCSEPAEMLAVNATGPLTGSVALRSRCEETLKDDVDQARDDADHQFGEQARECTHRTQPSCAARGSRLTTTRTTSARSALVFE